MAITKLPRNAIADDSINASKIEDGTVAIAEVSGTITTAKLKDGEIANAKLSNSTFTVRGTSRALGSTFTIGVDVDWQSKITSDGSTVTTMEATKGYFIDNTSAAGIVKLPTSASAGDTIAIKDYAGNFGTNALVIQRNGHNIQGVANDQQIETNRASLVLVYVDATKGWLYTNEHNVANLGFFTAATGGTVTTSGDHKIHAFTGDGCFVVSQASPAGVDYLVVAGGGGGGADRAGGGGAGGFRTASSFPISAQTYPITVGGGGAAGTYPNPTPGTAGSNSVFSSITSAGGGTGAASGSAGGNGGSGGGGGGAPPSGTGSAGGSGNTPPVSPPQGNPGGDGAPGDSGGGGGAGGAGQDTPGSTPGSGGSGVTSCITASPVPLASGGDGSPTTGPAGSPQPANSGKGAPGAGHPGRAGGTGGSGIVVIRYRYQ